MRAPRAISNLQLRVVSGVVMALGALLLAWLGGLPFRLLAVAIGCAIFFEWCAMSRSFTNGAHQAFGAVLLAVCLAALAVGFSAAVVLWLLAVAALALFMAGLPTGRGVWTVLGLLYAGLSAHALAFLRGADAAGLTVILFLFAIVWATDIMAYFVGRSVGGPKLAPAISPGKTQSGAVGGALGGVLAGALVALATGSSAVYLLVPLALFLSVLSQAGDLFESWVKRRCGVKDSGRLIPGHGGVMDRVDGLVVAAVFLYGVGSLAGGLDLPMRELLK